MLDCRQQHHMSHIGELLPHDFLSFNYIRGYPGNRSLVANRASQHDINIVVDTGMHDAAHEDFLLHSSGNSASLANGIDGAEMVLMSTSRKGKIGIHSQGGSIQSAFYIVRGKRISGEKAIDITRFNEARQMVVCAGSYNCRAGDDRDFTFRCACAPQLLTQFTNDGRFW